MIIGVLFSALVLSAKSHAELVFDSILIIENTADDFDTLFCLFSFLIFELVEVFFLRLLRRVGMQDDANVVDDFFEQLFDDFEVVDAFGSL